MSRAMNRHHRERIKNNRKDYWNTNGANHPRSVGRMVKTPCPCSCGMCCSPRKLYGNSQQSYKISEIRKMNEEHWPFHDEFDGLISNAEDVDVFVGFGEG